MPCGIDQSNIMNRQTAMNAPPEMPAVMDLASCGITAVSMFDL